jgi:hypothetical protein
LAEDLEISAMTSISEVLTPLEQDAKARVLTWAFNRFDVSSPPSSRPNKAKQNEDDDESGENQKVAQFQDFVDLFDASNVKTEPDRALVGGYWFQVIGEAQSFKGREVNDALKDIGHGASNITDALTTLQKRKPALVRQVAKSGRTRQAQKTYKLTQAGIRVVEQMISARDDDSAA